jgi:hypothetical protein
MGIGGMKPLLMVFRQYQNGGLRLITNDDNSSKLVIGSAGQELLAISKIARAGLTFDTPHWGLAGLGFKLGLMRARRCDVIKLAYSRSDFCFSDFFGSSAAPGF